MAVNLSPVGGVAGQFFDNNGNPLVGGKLYTYAAGTTTPQATFTSSVGGAANTNPIILNAGGRVPAEIWLTDGQQYKFVLYDANDVLIGSWDNIVGINSNFVNFVTNEEVQIATAGQTVFNLTTMTYQPGSNNLVVYVDGVNQVEGGSYSYVETDSDTVTFTSGLHLGAVVKFVSAETISTAGGDASNVRYVPAGTGAVATTVQTKLRETVSVKDFGAVGDGVADDTAAIQAALDAAKCVYFPVGDYKITGLNVTTQGQMIYGCGYNSHIQCASGTAFNITAGNVTITDFRMTGGYVASNIGFNVTQGFQCKIENIDIRLFDTGLVWNGGYHLYINNWHTRNFRSYGIVLNDGVGAFITKVTYDTDGTWYGGTYVMPTAFLVIHNEGNVISDCDFIHPGVGVLIEPNGRNIEWCLFSNCFIADSGFVTNVPVAGIAIRQSSNTYYIRGLFFDQVWSATNIRGLLVDGSGAASVGGLVFNDCMFHNNGSEGVRLTATNLLNITFNNCEIVGNNSQNTGANQFYVNNADIVKLNNCNLGNNFNWNTTPLYQFYVDANATNVSAVNTVFGPQVATDVMVILNGDQTKISYPEWTQFEAVTISAPTAGVIIGGDWLSCFNEVLIVYDNVAHSNDGDLNIKLSSDGGSNWSNISYQSAQGPNLIEEYEQDINGNRTILAANSIQGTLHVTNNRLGYKHFTYQSSLNAASGQNLMSIGTANTLNPINTIFFGWSLGNLTGGAIRVFVK